MILADSMDLVDLADFVDLRVDLMDLGMDLGGFNGFGGGFESGFGGFEVDLVVLEVDLVDLGADLGVDLMDFWADCGFSGFSGLGSGFSGFGDGFGGLGGGFCQERCCQERWLRLWSIPENLPKVDPGSRSRLRVRLRRLSATWPEVR